MRVKFHGGPNDGQELQLAFAEPFLFFALEEKANGVETGILSTETATYELAPLEMFCKEMNVKTKDTANYIYVPTVDDFMRQLREGVMGEIKK